MLSHLLNAWLVGVPPRDLMAFGLAALLVSAASLVACAIPAARAARDRPCDRVAGGIAARARSAIRHDASQMRSWPRWVGRRRRRHV